MRIQFLDETWMIDRRSSPSYVITGAEDSLATRKSKTGTETKCGGLSDDALTALLNGNESSAFSEDSNKPDPPHRLLRGPCTRNGPAFVEGIQRPQKWQRESKKDGK